MSDLTPREAVEVRQCDRGAADRLAIGHPFTCFDCADELALAFARHRQAAEAAAYERAAEVCLEQQQVFLSPEYATRQPFSSFAERFACGRCAEEIRLLAPQGAGERG